MVAQEIEQPSAAGGAPAGRPLKPARHARKRPGMRGDVKPYQWAILAVLWDGQTHTFGEILAHAGPKIEAGVASRAYLQGRKLSGKVSLTVEAEAKINVHKAVRQGRVRMVAEYLRQKVRWSGAVRTPGPRTKAVGLMGDIYQWPEAPGVYGKPLPPEPPQYHLGEEDEVPEVPEEEPAPEPVGEYSEERLARLEGEIEQGLRSYITIGSRLKLIRDEKLYLGGDFPTFEAYLDKKWGITRPHAFKVIKGSEVAEVLTLQKCNIPPP